MNMTQNTSQNTSQVTTENTAQNMTQTSTPSATEKTEDLTREVHRETLEGSIPEMATAEQRNAAFDAAFDYRGDVTIETADDRTVSGYVFDRRSEAAEPYVRVMRADDGQREDIAYTAIRRLTFSGKDPAAGRSWETWLRKYAEKKARGEAANIESEPLA